MEMASQAEKIKSLRDELDARSSSSSFSFSFSSSFSSFLLLVLFLLFLRPRNRRRRKVILLRETNIENLRFGSGAAIK